MIYVSGASVWRLFFPSVMPVTVPSCWLASASPHSAEYTQPWVWNVFTYEACYKLSAKTNFAWLGRSLHLAQMLFGSNLFQRLALSIWLSSSDGEVVSQMWTQAKGNSFSQCWRAFFEPAHLCLYEYIHVWATFQYVCNIFFHWQEYWILHKLWPVWFIFILHRNFMDISLGSISSQPSLLD